MRLFASLVEKPSNMQMDLRSKTRSVYQRMPLWLAGVIFGTSFYLILATASELLLAWLGPYRAYPPEKRSAPLVVYAILYTLSFGPGLLVGYPLSIILGRNLGMSIVRLISMATFSGIAALCLQLVGIRRGVVIFLVIFALLSGPLCIFFAAMAGG